MPEKLENKLDITNMGITDMNAKLEDLKNKLNHLLDIKSLFLKYYDPKTSNLKEVSVSGGKSVNPLELLILKKEKVDYDSLLKDIDFLKNYITSLEQLITKEEERIKKYDLTEQKIIELRDKGNTWLYISCNVNASVSTCRRTWDKYQEERKKTR